MRKLFLISFFLTFIFAGCVQGKPPITKNPVQPQNNATPAVLTVSEYFPLEGNRIYTYEGKGNEYASKVTSVEYVSGRFIQFNTNNGGTAVSEVFAIGQGAVRRVFSKEESYWRENFIGQRNKDEIYLQQPIKVGTEWVSNGKKYRIAAVDAKVTVPYGTYKTVKVVTELEDATVSRYFAKNIGIIKEEFVSGNTVVTSELSEIRYEPFKMKLDLYFPDNDATKVTLETKELEFNTNESLAEKLIEALKKPSSVKIQPVVSEGTRLLDYKREDRVLRLNLSKEFITGMNAGSGTEGLILQSLTNTFAKAFGVEGIILNIQGGPYQSGHFEFGKDEILKIKD